MITPLVGLPNGGHRAGSDYLEEGRHSSKPASPTIDYLRLLLAQHWTG
ncbi:hypothetical protein [Pseudomonas paeninsulae]|nr:hypothetical protein [Pseudomonas sp. IT1137]